MPTREELKKQMIETLMVTDSKNPDQLYKAVIDYVQRNWDHTGRSTKFAELNRRFNVVARRAKTTIKDLIKKAIENDALEIHTSKKGGMVIVTREMVDLAMQSDNINALTNLIESCHLINEEPKSPLS